MSLTQSSNFDYLLPLSVNLLERNAGVLSQVNYQETKTLSKKGVKTKIHHPDFPRLEVIWGCNGQARGVKLESGKLNVWLNLIPSPEDDEDDWNWYAGSATSILIGNQEMLEFFKSQDVPCKPLNPNWLHHDRQKRCMQVDKVQVWDEINNDWFEHLLFNQIYDLISHSISPSAVTVVIASNPFSYSNEDKYSKYRLYRIFHLLKDADYILEELFVSKVDASLKTITKVKFKAHYFTFMDLNLRRELSLHPSDKGFAMVSCLYPYPAYGFMSNVTLDRTVEYPTKNFPEWPNKYKTFSWGLSNCLSAKCLHGFSWNAIDNHPQFLHQIGDWPLLSW